MEAVVNKFFNARGFQNSIIFKLLQLFMRHRTFGRPIEVCKVRKHAHNLPLNFRICKQFGWRQTCLILNCDLCKFFTVYYWAVSLVVMCLLLVGYVLLLAFHQVFQILHANVSVHPLVIPPFRSRVTPILFPSTCTVSISTIRDKLDSRIQLFDFVVTVDVLGFIL